jgi:hypothetical protein
MRSIACLSIAAALAGCAAQSRPLAASGAGVGVAPDWRTIATDADRARIRSWRTAFTKALAAARAEGYGAQLAREGALLQPDAALPGPELPAGRYRCRVIKLGAQGGRSLDYIAYPDFDCRVADEGALESFAKLTGSQRPVGLIFDGDAERQIFLGTLVLGDERRAMDYGVDPDRDLAGAVERVGDKRWRLILPYPRFESIMDVIELVPVARG